MKKQIFTLHGESQPSLSCWSGVRPSSVGELRHCLITLFSLLFRFDSSHHCVCVYVSSDASDLFPLSLLPAQIFVIAIVPRLSRHPFVLGLHHETYLSEVFTPGYLEQLASISSSGNESCPLWFFTFHPLGPRCGPSLALVFMLLGVMLDARHRHHIQTVEPPPLCWLQVNH